MVRRQPHPDWNLQQLFCPCDRLLHRRQRHECHRHVAARVQRRPGQDVYCERRVWSHFDEWTLPSHSDTFRFESHRRSDVVHHRLELRRRERHVDRDVLEYFLVQRRVVVNQSTRKPESVRPSSFSPRGNPSPCPSVYNNSCQLRSAKPEHVDDPVPRITASVKISGVIENESRPS